MSKDTVTVHPDPGGVFLDGIPAVVQDVSAKDARWMVASGAFTTDPPTAPPGKVAANQPAGPADAGSPDSSPREA